LGDQTLPSDTAIEQDPGSIYLAGLFCNSGETMYQRSAIATGASAIKQYSMINMRETPCDD
jgi:hypothetical protein